MTAILLAALIGMQPAEAHTGKSHARPPKHHQKAKKPRAVPQRQWVWMSGHWQRRGHSTVWVWGYWQLRPAAPHAHRKGGSHRG